MTIGAYEGTTTFVDSILANIYEHSDVTMGQHVCSNMNLFVLVGYLKIYNAEHVLDISDYFCKLGKMLTLIDFDTYCIYSNFSFF